MSVQKFIPLFFHQFRSPLHHAVSPRQTVADLYRHLILSWLLAVTVEYLHLPTVIRSLNELDGLPYMSLPRVVGSTCLCTLLLWGLGHFFSSQKSERWCMTAIFAILATTSILASPTWPFFLLSTIILVGLVIYSIFGWDFSKKHFSCHCFSQQPLRSHPVFGWLAAILALVFFLFVTVWTVSRVYSFRSPTYDFGIFSQMFYYLKKTGIPMTTLERDGLLSHFAVHVSPIFYLLLPFYTLVPTPATLQVLQAAVLTWAVVPLWKLGKHHGLSAAHCMLLCGLLLFYPAFSGGTSYDIHENCFLTPLILWLFYGLDRRNIILTLSSVLFVLMVKEDAAVYVAVIGLWMILKTLLHLHSGKQGSLAPSKSIPTAAMSVTSDGTNNNNSHYNNRRFAAWDLVLGIVLMILSLTWFFCVTNYLAQSGDGVMTYRYKNFLYDGSSSLFAVVKAVFLQPMKALYECVDPEKLPFLGLTLLPLLGLPLLTRRYERYLLLIPYVLVNLMSDYTYQHSIFFQYTFGSTAFLLYLALVNLADLPKERQRTIPLAAALISSLFCFAFTVVPKAIVPPIDAIRHYQEHQMIRDTLEEIPEDAAVTATTFFTTWLSERKILYDINYCSRDHLLTSEYIVLDPRNSYKKYASTAKNDGFQNLITLLEVNGYHLDRKVEHALVIYRKDTSSDHSVSESLTGQSYPHPS